MKVKELIEVLKKYPPDLPVVALWDCGWSKMDKHSIQKDQYGNEVVEFDVTEYGTAERDV